MALSASAASPSATASSSSSDPNPNPTSGSGNPSAWWESISRARARIDALAALLPPTLAAPLASLADSDRPARALLSSPAAYAAVSEALSAPASGSGSDPLCHWLYDTLLSADHDLHLTPLSFVPLLCGLYLTRTIASSSSPSTSPPPSLAGFEAVLLALYNAECKSRAGRPLVVHIPDLSQPSLYHAPRPTAQSQRPISAQPTTGVVAPPLEPQVAVKSTKRALIVAVALDSYYKKISLMPSRSKIDFCEFTVAWAGQDCRCRHELDDDQLVSTPTSFESKDLYEENEIGGISEEMDRLVIGERDQERINGRCSKEGKGETKRGTRVPLPWELLQPVLRILGHCLLAPLNPPEVRDAASEAVRCVYARAMHDLMPQAILTARSLIRLDKSARIAAKAAVLAAASTGGTGSNPNTPSKPKKPEVLLVSK